MYNDTASYRDYTAFRYRCSVSAVSHIARSYMGSVHLKRKLCYTEKAKVAASYVCSWLLQCN